MCVKSLRKGEMCIYLSYDIEEFGSLTVLVLEIFVNWISWALLELLPYGDDAFIGLYLGFTLQLIHEISYQVDIDKSREPIEPGIFVNNFCIINRWIKPFSISRNSNAK